MAFESLEYRADDHSAPMPLQIAHNHSLTAREKLDLLTRLKAEVTGEAPNPDGLGYGAEEIDAAIAELRAEGQDGERPLPSFIAEANDERLG